MTEEDRAAWAGMLRPVVADLKDREGFSARKIAAQADLSPPTVGDFLKENGIPHEGTLEKLQEWANRHENSGPRLVREREVQHYGAEGLFIPSAAIERLVSDVTARCKYLDANAELTPPERKARKLDSIENDRRTFKRVYNAVPQVLDDLQERIERDEL